MIQPISMMSNPIAATPVSFSPKKLNLNNGTQKQSNYLNVGTKELSPNVTNSAVGQKLDFYA